MKELFPRKICRVFTVNTPTRVIELDNKTIEYKKELNND